MSLAAAETLAATGIDAEVIDLRTLKPWDTETVLASVEKTGRLVLVQEPARTAGNGSRGCSHRRRRSHLLAEGTHHPRHRLRRSLAAVRRRGPRHHHPQTSRRSMPGSNGLRGARLRRRGHQSPAPFHGAEFPQRKLRVPNFIRDTSSGAPRRCHGTRGPFHCVQTPTSDQATDAFHALRAAVANTTWNGTQ